MAPETATHRHRAENPIANLRLYWRLSGVALAGVAALGIVLNLIYVEPFLGDPSFLLFDWTHNVLHVVLAAIALTFGFGRFAEATSAMMAKVIGVTYLALGALGFVPAVADALDSLLGLHLELGENLIHLTLGAWGAYAGFTSPAGDGTH